MPVRMFALLACVLCASVALGGCGGDEPRSAVTDERQAQASLAGSPAPLAALHRQANQLLGGGVDAYDARVRALRGYPVVVNKWASWCYPCRQEFPAFQKLGVEYGKRVAFMGLNAGDAKDNAADFLLRFPVTYPSYEDPREDIARSINAATNFPITVFYDRAGKITYRHQGGYQNEEKLKEDIERYALG